MFLNGLGDFFRPQQINSDLKLVKYSSTEHGMSLYDFPSYVIKVMKKLEDKGFKVENLIEFPGH